jgi:hypothetical protein
MTKRITLTITLIALFTMWAIHCFAGGPPTKTILPPFQVTFQTKACPTLPLNYPCDAFGNPTYTNYDIANLYIQEDTISAILRRLIGQVPLVAAACPSLPLNYPCDASGNPTYTSYDIANCWIQDDTIIALLRKFTPGGGGTVTSVGLAAPSVFNVTGSPVTTAGTLTFAATNSQGYLFNSSGTLSWVPIHSYVKDSAWLLTGNTIGASGAYIGTNDSETFVVKVNGINHLVLGINHHSIKIGERSLQSNTTGIYNIGNGDFTLYNNTSGEGNSAEGYKSQELNVTGSGNTSYGQFSLLNNIVDDNTAVGDSALTSNTTGIFNTAVGYQANVANTNGANNTSVGYQAQKKTTTGVDNTAAGAAALNNNVTGSGNTAIGMQALFSILSNDNTGEGTDVMHYSTGSNQTGFGFEAGYLNTNGVSNLYAGSYAGYSPSTNSSRGCYLGDSTAYSCVGVLEGCTFLGWHANGGTGASSPLVNATAIGGGALITASNGMHLGNAAVDSIITSGIVMINNPITTATGAGTGSATFSEPFGGNDFKKVVIYCNALMLSTVSYTFPVAFTNTPGIVVTYGTGGSIVVLPTVIASLSTTAITITVTNPTTGYIMLEGN